MTIAEAIERIDTLKPNKFSQNQKIGWLNELDGIIHNELVMTHELMDGEEDTFEGYGADTDTTTVLLVPAPYTDVYQYYLACQIDLGNAEIAKFQNDKVLYNNSYLTYSDYYTRTHMPKCVTDHIVL